jgi:hypothetical protein
MALAERGKEMIIIVAVLVALASIAVLLRVYVRLKLHIGFAIDDYLCFATLFFLYGMLVELVLCECDTISKPASKLTFGRRVYDRRKWQPRWGARCKNFAELWKGNQDIQSF